MGVLMNQGMSFAKALFHPEVNAWSDFWKNRNKPLLKDNDNDPRIQYLKRYFQRKEL